MFYDQISENVIGENAIDRDVAYSTELVGQECIGCMRALPFNQFRRDTSLRNDRKQLCISCENSPRLSTEEHVFRQFEKNYTAASKQRWLHNEDYQQHDARVGNRMWAFDFLNKLKQIRGYSSLYLMPGNIVGDLAVFRIDKENPQYLMYIPTLYAMPEFSIIEFDIRDVPVREKQRGWRTILLRLIKAGIMSEQDVRQVFGEPEGVGGTVYRRELYIYRNQLDPTKVD